MSGPETLNDETGWGFQPLISEQSDEQTGGRCAGDTWPGHNRLPDPESFLSRSR